MDIQHTVIVSRMAERILVSLIGAFAIYLGYLLFAITTPSDSTGVVTWGNLKLDVWHVGPGVFFALFGAGLIGYTVARPVEYQRQSRQGGRSGTEQTETLRSLMEPRAEPAGGIALSAVPGEQAVGTLAEMAGELDQEPATRPRREALRDARVSLMLASWKQPWGRQNVFQDWVYNSGEMDPPPTSIPQAVAVFRGTTAKPAQR